MPTPSYLAKVRLNYHKKSTKQLNTKAANWKKIAKEHEAELEVLRPLLAQWQAWAQEYKDATKDSYEEAAKAQEDRRHGEQILLTIRNLIDHGDRGAATALQQIGNIIDEHLSNGAY